MKTKKKNEMKKKKENELRWLNIIESQVDLM